MRGIKKWANIRYAAVAFMVLMVALAQATIAHDSGSDPNGPGIRCMSSRERAGSPTGNHRGDAQVIKSSRSGDSGSEVIKWQIISSGGTLASQSSMFRLSGTAGQTAVGAGTSSNYSLSHGFWHVTAGGETLCDCNPGDPNADLSINVGDAVYIINYVFKGGPPPVPYAICSGDANCDCQCNVGDAVYIINYVFKGGPVPCGCEEWLVNCGAPLRN